MRPGKLVDSSTPTYRPRDACKAYVDTKFQVHFIAESAQLDTVEKFDNDRAFPTEFVSKTQKSKSSSARNEAAEIASPYAKAFFVLGPVGLFLVKTQRMHYVCSKQHNKLELRRSTWSGEMLTTAHAARLARRTGGRKGKGKEGRAFAKSDEVEEEKRKAREGNN
ncbi:hypothetical protein PUN28_016511 [Cardiocondyla obscurior]|uniref:Uncharacterized protein n=1 Tax=Cardiocondyla obscurior TaxID=286306 RepID=A0AAW2ERB1_9HYME